MANLINLQEFDRELSQFYPKINKFHDAITRNAANKVWSQQQRDDLVLLQYAVTGLANAVRALASPNRDGRG